MGALLLFMAVRNAGKVVSYSQSLRLTVESERELNETEC